MPSPIAHSVSGYIISQFFPLDGKATRRVEKWGKYSLYAVFVANIPDLDFIPQLLTGERYHHGLTHSLTFTILFSTVIGLLAFLFKKQLPKRLFFLSLIIYSSHLLLDFFTEGGKGIQLLWPFTESFFKSPIAIFPGAHHSRGLFHSSHLIFIGAELVYSAFLLFGLWAWKKVKYS